MLKLCDKSICKPLNVFFKSLFSQSVVKFSNVLFINTMFPYFIENNLISENQSGFKIGDSCINQLLAIIHEIFSGFNDNYEVKGVFLDMSKAFDKVWHEGIIHKLKRNVISGNLISLLTDLKTCKK